MEVLWIWFVQDLEVMMFNNASSFRKIGKGKYHFINGSVWCKKAYVVTYKEKKKIESLIYELMKRTISMGLPFYLMSRFFLWPAIISFAFGIYGAIRVYNKKLKKLLNNREKVPVEPTGIYKHYWVMVENLSTADRKKTVLMLFFFIFFICIFFAKLDGTSSVFNWLLMGGCNSHIGKFSSNTNQTI